MVPMLKEDELIGVIVILPPGSSSLHRQADRAGHRTLPLRPSSPSRTRGCSTNCGSAPADLTKRWSSRRLPRRCSKLSAVLLAILKPVFATMLEKAVRICDAKLWQYLPWDGESLTASQSLQHTRCLSRISKASADSALGLKSPSGRMVANKNVVHIADLAGERAYVERSDPVALHAVELGGIRTLVVRPDAEGRRTDRCRFTLSRQEVRPFTDKQIELVQTLPPSVIAIENARLLKELRERTDQLEAQSKSLSSSTNNSNNASPTK